MNQIRTQGYGTSSDWHFLAIWDQFKAYFSQWFYENLISEPAAIDYRHRYIQHLIDYHYSFRGLSPPTEMRLFLTDVFIEPHLRPSAPASVNHSSALPPQSTQPNASIWHYLDAQQSLLIVGPPGSGKTTLLAHMALTLSKQDTTHHAIERLPILLKLCNHNHIINKTSTYTLAEAIRRTLRASQMSEVPPMNWFTKQLEQGQCVIMFDGLDEVSHLPRVTAWVKQQFERYPNNKFITTSRYTEHVGFEHLTRLSIEPFADEQRQSFIKKWYLACQLAVSDNEWHAQMQAKLGSESLIQLISDLNLKHLATNPLLLTIMSTLHHREWQEHDHRFADPIKLPTTQIGLYSAFCSLLLEESGNKVGLAPIQIQRVLQALAYHMMTYKKSVIQRTDAYKVLYVPLDMESRNPQVSEFLQTVAEYSSLLEENKGYSFINRTFQEYFAAMHVQQKWLAPELVNAEHLNDPWWYETIHLYGACFDMTSVIATCLSQTSLTLSMLRLVTRYAQGLYQVEPAVLVRLEKRLHTEIESADIDPIRRTLVANILLSFHLKRLVPIDQQTSVANTLVANAYYKLFFDEQAQDHVSLVQPTGWDEGMYPVDQALKPVTGVPSTDAIRFCQWLTKRSQTASHYRVPYAGEFSSLLADTSYWSYCQNKQLYKLENQKPLNLSLDSLGHQLYLTLVQDLRQYGEVAHERALLLILDLDEIDTLSEAMTLACQFAHDRAHKCLLDHSGKKMSVKKRLAFEDANFVAKFITERLINVLRQKPGFRVNDSDAADSPSTTLAKAYFELYEQLTHYQEGEHAQGGIRLVTSHSIASTTSSEQNHANHYHFVIEPSKKEADQDNTKRSHLPLPAAQTTAIELIDEPTDGKFAKRYDPKRVIQRKTCLLGDMGVGKTSLMRRFVTGYFDERYLSTVGVNISRKTLIRQTSTINMLLWEIEGADGLKKKHLNFLRGVSGAIIVCDLTRYHTLLTLERYAKQLRELNPSAAIVLVANKADLPIKRVISDDELHAIAHKLNAPYLLTSAKTDTQVNEAFSLLADQIEQKKSIKRQKVKAFA